MSRRAFPRLHRLGVLTGVLILSSTLLTALQRPTIYHINPSTGDDSNDGSSGSPWLTIQECDDNSGVTSGDTCQVTDDAIIRENDIALDKGGVIYTAASGDTPTIRGTSTITTTADWSNTAYTHVYRTAKIGTIVSVAQTAHCPELTARDPSNGSRWTLEAGECIGLTAVESVAAVETNEGSFHDDGSDLYIQVWDSGDPTSTEYSIEYGFENDGSVTITGAGVRWYGFRHEHTEVNDVGLTVNGDGITVGNVTLIDSDLDVGASASNTIIRNTLVDICGDRGGDPLEFHQSGTGRNCIAVAAGATNTLIDLSDFFRGWNGAVDSANDTEWRDTRLWGHPNHAWRCKSISGTTLIVRMVNFNAQDSLHVTDCDGLTVEHSFLAESVILQSGSASFTMRNSVVYNYADGGDRILLTLDTGSNAGFDSDYNLLAWDNGGFDELYLWAVGQELRTLNHVQTTAGQENNSDTLDLSGGGGEAFTDVFAAAPGRLSHPRQWDFTVVTGSKADRTGAGGLDLGPATTTTTTLPAEQNQGINTGTGLGP